MKRTRFGRRSSLPREAEELLWLASGLAESGSHAEDGFWQVRLSLAVDALLRSGSEETLNATLDHLYTANPNAYDALADMLEARAECGARKIEEKTSSDAEINEARTGILLIAAPILAWSRFSIPANKLPAAVLANLRVHLTAHVLADNIELALSDILFSPDQLPQGYCETTRFAAQLGWAAEHGHDLVVDAETLPETSRFLSDVRYILAAVSFKHGEPIFRWQETDGTREQSTTQWRTQGGACLTSVLAGCAIELVLPDAFFAASRHADRVSRPYSIRASVAFLTTTLNVPPNRLRAVVAAFYENQLEEYRISFMVAGSDDVVHGVVWPLLGVEDDGAEIFNQIEVALRECSVTDIVQLDNRFAMEYCEDCGAPMYPTPEGETVHAELPEDAVEQVPRHLH
ncbi:MAG TPA: DUF2863 family protein [Rhodocyclaceae bacterium]|nr:DUF2863 family protein [Rhodocyclaceae bacterium]